jgi:predicted Zn-dependent protease
VIGRGSGLPLRRPLGWLCLAAALTAGCGVRTIPAIGAGGAPFVPEADERALWVRAEQERAALVERTWVYRDPLLEDHLDRIVERLLPASARVPGAPVPRIVVLADPTLNAFALPDGRLYLHTGLLSRLQGDGEIAAVLARELAHVVRRHALRCVRGRGGETLDVVGDVARVGAAASALAAADHDGAAALSRTALTILGQRLQLAALVSIHGYGANLEREADRIGMQWLADGGWAPAEMVRAFARLAEDAGDRGGMELFRLGTPRALRARHASARGALARAPAAVGVAPAPARDDALDARLRAVVRENAWLDLRAGRFALARRQLDRVIAAEPDDPIAHLYYGDLHRRRSQRAGTAAARVAAAQQARERYERAAALDPAYAAPHRELGLLHYQQGDPARARAAFARYLELNPEAPDARRIREYVVELSRE